MSDRIILTCHTCGESADLPNKGMGRAMAGAWRTQHQGHDTEEADR